MKTLKTILYHLSLALFFLLGFSIGIISTLSGGHKRTGGAI